MWTVSDSIFHVVTKNCAKKNLRNFIFSVLLHSLKSYILKVADKSIWLMSLYVAKSMKDVKWLNFGVFIVTFKHTLIWYFYI